MLSAFLLSLRKVTVATHPTS